MTTISAKTKISDIVKENPASIQAIASLAKPLEKLRNPILRKIMASRVTIAEAAKMGGVTVSDFQRVLSPLGFIFEANERDATPVEPSFRPHWLVSAGPSLIDYYNVRPLIDGGADPLKSILGRFKAVPAGGILCVINSFIPTPLIHLLKQEKAEDAYVETIDSQEYRTYFLKKGGSTSSETQATTQKLVFEDERNFETLCGQYAEKQLKRIDVRALPMPEPMYTILAALEDLQEGHALYVQHKRVPVYLLEELADKNYVVHVCKVQEGDVKMLIVKI